MPNGLSYQMSDIKTETQDNMPEGQTLTFITATIHLGGKINCEVKDLFLLFVKTPLFLLLKLARATVIYTSIKMHL